MREIKCYIEAFFPKALMMRVYLAMVSAAAYSPWGILLKYEPVLQAAVFRLMNPVFGAQLSALFINEAGTLGARALISLVPVCRGIYIVNSRDGKIITKQFGTDKL